MKYDNVLTVSGQAEDVAAFVALLNDKGFAGHAPVPKRVTRHKLWKLKNWGPEKNIDAGDIRTLSIDGELLHSKEGWWEIQIARDAITTWVLTFETEGSSAWLWFEKVQKRVLNLQIILETPVSYQWTHNLNDRLLDVRKTRLSEIDAWTHHPKRTWRYCYRS